MTQTSYVEEESFERDMEYLPDRITRDSARWPVEPGRYRLVAARACPWANRAIIVRRLLGLEDVISLGLCGPTHVVRRDAGFRHRAIVDERTQRPTAAIATLTR